MKINREGHIIIITVLLVFVAIVYLLYRFVAGGVWCEWVWCVSILLLILFTLVSLFFREPMRGAEVDDNLIYAPCDGKVVVTEVVNEREWLGEDMMQISIFMSVANVHVNWLPVSGKVEHYKHHDGRFLLAWNPKSSELNERTTTVIRCKDGERIVVRQIAGYVARRIVSYMSEGREVVQNDKLGFIKFGSRIDVLIPKSAVILVKLGDRTVGAESVIAKFK